MDFIVCVSKQNVPGSHQIFVTDCVPCPAVFGIMLSSIHLNDYLQLRTVKIDNVIVDRPLSVDREWDVFQEAVPEPLFLFCHIPAKHL